MANKRLTDEDIQYIHKKIHDTDRYVPKWRRWMPVNPNGKPKVAHYAKFYTLKDIPDGSWTLFKQNASLEENAVTAYSPTSRYFLQLVRKWSIHKNDLEASEDGRIRTDSILKIRKSMEKQIEKIIINGGTVGDQTVYGLVNDPNVQSGTDGNGNGMTEIYNLVKELKNLLVAEDFTNKSKWWFIHDSTIDGYLDLINSSFGETARKKLTEAGIISEAREHLTASGQFTPDSNDAAMMLLESDPENFFVLELTNGINVEVFYDGALSDDMHYHGYLEWVGVLCVPNGKAIAKNTGVASS